MIRNVLLIFILERMFDRGPEIHGQSPDLDLRMNAFGPVHGLHIVLDNHMITAVAAVFHVVDIVFFFDDFHIRPGADDLHHLLDVFHKLADNPDARDILQFFFYLIDRNILFLRFIQNAGNRLDPSMHLLDRGIQPLLTMFLNQMFKFHSELFHCQIIRIQDLSP